MTPCDALARWVRDAALQIEAFARVRPSAILLPGDLRGAPIEREVARLLLLWSVARASGAR